MSETWAQVSVEHNDYVFTKDEVQLIRDCVEGEIAIKQTDRRSNYLPYPGVVTGGNNYTKDDYTRRLYQAYVDRAEYDNFPLNTLDSWVGMMKLSQAKFGEDNELPSEIQHLMENADGDGTTLHELLEITASNVLQVKYHGLLNEYGNYQEGDEPNQRLTAQEAQRLGITSSIKSYPRESIIDWDFDFIDGVRQFKFIKLKEELEDKNVETFSTEYTTNYLILAIDSEGHYYQQKFFSVDNGAITEGERIYPKANGQLMRSIPFELVIDQKQKSTYVPRALGSLYPICKKAIARYRTSADLNRALAIVGVPTVFTRGWKQGDMDLFNEINVQSEIEFGSGRANNLPNNVEIDIQQMDGDSQPLFAKLDRNEREALALGARYDTDPKSMDATATQAIIRNAKENALLTNVADSLEVSFQRVLERALAFHTSREEEIPVSLNKDFANVGLTPQQREMIIKEVQEGFYTREIAIQKLIDAGEIVGFTVDEVMTMLGTSGTIED